jgi:hypothetical protein
LAGLSFGQYFEWVWEGIFPSCFLQILLESNQGVLNSYKKIKPNHFLLRHRSVTNKRKTLWRNEKWQDIVQNEEQK